MIGGELMALVKLIPVLQTAIGPVILISGVGLLLLNMTNRLGRTIDRARQLVAQLQSGDENARRRNKAQLQILWQRALLLRSAIALAATSALLAAVLIIVLFLSVLFEWEGGWIVGLLFIGCLLAVIGSLVYFLRDVNVSLCALALELGMDEKEST